MRNNNCCFSCPSCPSSVVDAALAVAGKVADHANLYLRRMTELDAMLRIQGMLGSAFDVVKPSRKLIKVSCSDLTFRYSSRFVLLFLLLLLLFLTLFSSFLFL